MKKLIFLLGVIFCISVIWFLFLQKQNTQTVITETKTETITTVETDDGIKYVKNKIGYCVRNARNITTENQDGMVVAMYEEYIFKCLCKGKFLDDYTFKSSNPVAGEICDNQCDELCQKQ